MSHSTTHNIVFINQHYWPDVAPTGLYLKDLCDFLSVNNWNVHVICGPATYNDLDRTAIECDQQNEQKVHVHRVNISLSGKRSNVARVNEYVRFFLSARTTLKQLSSKPDIAVTLTTPPFAEWLLNVVPKQTKRMSWMMDLHPEAEFATGMISQKSLLGRLLTNLKCHWLKQLDAAVVLSSDMKHRLVANYPFMEKKARQIGIWDRVEMQMDGQLIQNKSPKTRILYTGNLGLVHDLEGFKHVLSQLGNDETFDFMFVGSGLLMHKLRDWVERQALSSVSFHPYLPDEKHQRWLQEADLLWFSLAESCTGVAFPSKVLSYIVANKPILFFGDEKSHLAHLIREESGLSLTPSKGDQAVDWIKNRTWSQVRRSGNSSLMFSKNMLLAQWNTFLNELL